MTYQIHVGDCLDILRQMPDNSVDSIVTDPPYGLSKEPDMAEVLRHWLAGDDYQHKSGGFMGKSWDSFVPGPAIWRECLRVLKPGGHLLAFFGTRTQDMGTLAIRLAGFEIRDSIAWVYGSGFPKSLDVSKAIDKMGGQPWGEIEREITAPATDAARQWQGWGTALKPALEPITVARKPLIGTVAANVLAHGTGALNIDGCRPDFASEGDAWNPEHHKQSSKGDGYCGINNGHLSVRPSGRWPANLIHDGSDEVVAAFPVSTGGVAGRRNARGGTKPHSVYGDYENRPMPDICFGGSGSAARFFYCAKASRKDRNEGCEHLEATHTDEQNKLHGAIEYRNICSVCERVLSNSVRECCGVVPERVPSERATRTNNHPTVKPTNLMAYLCRLVTPPGGTVLDPFMGSGSTGKAAIREGFRFIGCERDQDENGNSLGYMAIAEARIEAELRRVTANLRDPVLPDLFEESA